MLFRYEGIARVTESNVPLISLSLSPSWDLSVTMKCIRGTCSDRDPQYRKKRVKKPSQSSIPDTVKFISDLKIRKSADQPDAGMLRWSNLIIFMQRVSNVFLPSFWIFRFFLWCYIFFLFLCGGDGFMDLRRGRSGIQSETQNKGYRMSNGI